MSSDEVRLWRNEWPTSMFGPPYRGSGEIRYETCERPALSEPGVWMRAAHHAALMRVVEAARIERAARLTYRELRLTEPVGNDALRALIWAENELISAVDAYLATAPEQRGEAPRA